MTLVIKKPTGAKLNLSKSYTPIDWEAADYARRVELADGQPLEQGVFNAINAFVLGCKADGTWSAIKASCILAGARTLNGALVPLVGTAPTNFNFVSGDYNRKTGLVGNGSTKYLNSGTAAASLPQNSLHTSVYLSFADGFGTQVYLGNLGSFGGTTLSISGSQIGIRNNASTAYISGSSTLIGLIGSSRASGASFQARFGGANFTATTSSQTPDATSVFIFRQSSTSQPFYTTARLAFYSIGESLDLALLDARVTDLINAIAAAIP